MRFPSPAARNPYLTRSIRSSDAQFELKEMKRRQEAAEEAERQRLQAEQEARAAAEAEAAAARQSRDSHDAPGSPQRDQGNYTVIRTNVNSITTILLCQKGSPIGHLHSINYILDVSRI